MKGKIIQHEKLLDSEDYFWKFFTQFLPEINFLNNRLIQLWQLFVTVVAVIIFYYYMKSSISLSVGKAEKKCPLVLYIISSNGRNCLGSFKYVFLRYHTSGTFLHVPCIFSVAFQNFIIKIVFSYIVLFQYFFAYKLKYKVALIYCNLATLSGEFIMNATDT